MKHTQKTKAKHPGAKKPAARAATSTRRAPVNTKPRRRQSEPVGRKLDQIPVMPVSAIEPRRPSMPYLFWPALSFTMMRLWWGLAKHAKAPDAFRLT
jgi:hypothetical protein